MKVRYMAKGFEVEYEASSLLEVFAFVGTCEQYFCERSCGNCGSDKTRLNYTTTKAGYAYYSVLCKECGWRLQFGQRRDGNSLFPKSWEPPYQSQDREDYSGQPQSFVGGGGKKGGQADAKYNDADVPF